ncbi:uncharacterized protein LOC135087057 isoform X2 [Ostrinia nubilalis]|uniref:uncharacterized protein LOC135087057 isoform X2 n=1 Tax=Ostrinia nubilalis TaxID=29057 RepID=UPI0030826A59
MKKLTRFAWALLPLLGGVLCENNTSTNSSDPNKDMGNQEALTFYHTNGSKVDLSNIPAPLLTNVTAQSMVQVAPKHGPSGDKSQVSWSALKNLASLPQFAPGIKSSGNVPMNIAKRSIFDEDMPEMMGELEYFDVPGSAVNKRSADSLTDLFKRDASDKATVKVVKGAAVIPQGAGVQSIALPPLLSLNNNLSDIPVPIPNTSIVHYAKINTVVRKP